MRNKHNFKKEVLLKIREHDKEYQRLKRKNNPKMKTLESTEFRKKYPERKSACQKVYKALLKGLLKKEKCRDCKRIDTQAHHKDYYKPLEVIWLCPIHHKLEHQRSYY